VPETYELRGTMGRQYKNFKHMKGDIDDGCMRAITLISSGRKKVHAYIGVKKEETMLRVKVREK